MLINKHGETSSLYVERPVSLQANGMPQSEYSGALGSFVSMHHNEFLKMLSRSD